MHHILNAIPSGSGKAWVIYERFCELLFTRLFYPTYIDKPLSQIISPFPEQRRDIILPVIATDGFWHYLACVYGGDLIMMECKNHVDPITPAQVEETRKYLRRPSVASIAFLTSRHDPSREAFECAIDIYRSDRKLIIFLSDNELHQLIECKDEHRDPITALRRIYQNQKSKM